MNLMRRFRSSDGAVSSVIGALLVTAILITFLGVVRVEFVPVVESGVEGQHLLEVEQQMSSLASALLSSEGDALRSETISLAPSQFVNFGSPRLPGTLTLGEQTDGLIIQSSAFAIATEAVSATGDISTAVPARINWAPLNGDVSATNIQQVNELRFRIVGVGNRDPLITETVTFADASGQEAARLVIEIEPSRNGIRAQVTSFDGGRTPIHENHYWISDDLNTIDFYVDAMSHDLRIAQTLAASEAPFTMKIAFENGFTQDILGEILEGGAPEYAFTFVDTSGSAGGGNDGTTEPFAYALNSTRIAYDYAAQHALDRDYILEHGALLVAQPDGVAIKSTPGLLVSGSGRDLIVQLSVPEIVAGTNSNQGLGAATVTLSPQSTHTVSGTTSDLEFTLATEHAAAWAEHWAWSLAAAGFGTATGATPGLQTVVAEDSVTIGLSSSDITPRSQFDRIILKLTTPSFGAGLS